MFDPWNHAPIWHAINVHLPVVLAMLGLPLVIFLTITRGRSRALAWFSVLFYFVLMLSAAFASRTGEAAMAELPATLPQAAWDRVNFHEWMAEKVWIFAAVTGLLLLLSNIPRRSFRQTFLALSLVASVATVAWVFVTGHSGGVAVYEYGLGTALLRGNDAETPTTAPTTAPTTQTVVSSPESDRSHGRQTVGNGDAPPSPAPIVPTTPPPPALASGAAKEVIDTNLASYTKQIKPILTARCVECHAGEKPKGAYTVTSVPALLKSGKKAGPGVVPGKPAESSLVQYIKGTKSPRMPKGADPMPAEEIALIERWITQGAVDDSGKTMPAEAGTPAVAETTPAPTPAPGPTTQASVAPFDAFDPPVKWDPRELVAVRRYLRLQFAPPAPPAPAVEAPEATPVNNEIDKFIVAKWKAASGPTAGVKPELCDDATFVRRVYLDVIGVIPPAVAAQKFVEDKAPDKRAKLIDALLARDVDYAANWVPFWEDALTSNGNHQGGVGTHGNYRDWAFQSFRTNKPYDAMATELLDPTMPGHPGRYILNDNHQRTIQSAADTAQVFLGTAIKCASCHSHFENNEWPQARAVAFAGYFAPKDLELVRCEKKTGEFIGTHFMFDLPGAPKDVPEDPGKRMRRVAQLITDPANPRFAKTIVNRLWKRYLGLGLFEPQDDYREDRPASHPELLEWLASDFVREGYNIKHTVRLILNSRTYQLKYDPALEDKFDLEKPAAPRFYRSPSLRRLTAEQLLDSIAVAVRQAELSNDDRLYTDDASTELTRALGRPATRNEVSTQRPDDTAVVQTLQLMNGTEYHDRVYKGDLVAALSVMEKGPELVAQAYWSALNRAPSEQEVAASVAFLSSAPPPPTTAPVELAWVDDALPGGSKPVKWKWVYLTDKEPAAGKASHTVAGGPPKPDESPLQQHMFTGGKLRVNPTDTLFAYVFIDANEASPKELMIQWHANGNWNRRAAWGEDLIEFMPRNKIGSVPKVGEWVRLEVPAAAVGITVPITIDGMSFDQWGGKVHWDKAGVVKGPAANHPETIGDLIWALLSTPEFQYIR